jgi:hypothetical protein
LSRLGSPQVKSGCGMGALFTMPTLLKRVTALMGRIRITARSLSRRLKDNA